jgi:protein TonB
VLDQLDQPLRPRGYNADPRYPPNALRRRLEGAVTVEMLIDERGEIAETKVTGGSEPFVEFVLDAVRQWKFTAPLFRGKPVRVWGVKTFRFEIPDREEKK